MLVRFNVRNFLSFSERIDVNNGEVKTHEFSMLPGKVRQNTDHIYCNDIQNILRLSAIYGANAAGKSNITKAIYFFQTMTILGKSPIGTSEMYSKTSAENINKPSYFECEILINNAVYAYGFEVVLSTGVIVSEWLTLLSKNKSHNLFYKDGEKDNYHFGNILTDNKSLEVYQQGILGSNVLFLTEMNKDKLGFYANHPELKILNDLFDWIKNKLEVISPNMPAKETSFLINTTSLNKVADLLNSFGTGVVSVKKIKEDPNKVIDSLPASVRNELHNQIDNYEKNARQNPNNLIQWGVLLRNRYDIIGLEFDKNLILQAYSVQFVHGNTNSDIYFKISEESDGTARLFELIEILISQKDKTYIIDELDRCLHPSLTYKFIEMFFQYTRGRKVQLIVTTHESRLMDFKLLRKDEIWFTEKDKSGNSNIYSLDEYNARFDQKVDKAYLDGRYGGVPIFTTLFPIGE